MSSLFEGRRLEKAYSKDNLINLNSKLMNLTFRTNPKKEDIENIREIVKSTGFFYEHEVEIAVELIEERMHKGIKSGYHFIFAEVDGKTAGYSCYGHIATTKSNHDLYWIVTHNDFRGKGIGKKLLEETYKEVRAMGGTALYAETSGRDHYAPTRHFYNSNGYSLEATLKDFYDEGDDKLVYVKRL
jgi:ribosomal protein S18 acetylase RimI-like enzyme